MKKNQETSLDHDHQNLLYQTVADINSSVELKLFFEDLFTPVELQAIAGRYLAAKLLNQGMTQREVAKTAGLSVATVTRVARCLANPKGGYNQIGC